MIKNLVIVVLAIALLVSITDENPFQSTVSGMKAGLEQDYNRARITVLDSLGVEK